MVKKLKLNNGEIQYDLKYKNVKNINLCIKPDRTIHVSANKYISESVIDEFLISREDFIFNALRKFENIPKTSTKQYFEENEVRELILRICERVFPYYEERGVTYPEIKFKRMVSRWGSCHVAKNLLTFNLNLMYAPKECIEYVVLHEFTHFLQGNHSKYFYEELKKVCPDYKECKAKLKKIYICK